MNANDYTLLMSSASKAPLKVRKRLPCKRKDKHRRSMLVRADRGTGVLSQHKTCQAASGLASVRGDRVLEIVENISPTSGLLGKRPARQITQMHLAVLGSPFLDHVQLDL